MKNLANPTKSSLVVAGLLSLFLGSSAFACGPKSKGLAESVRLVTNMAMGADDKTVPLETDPRVKLDTAALKSSDPRIVRLANMAPSAAYLTNVTGTEQGSGIFLNSRCHVLSVRHVFNKYSVVEIPAQGRPGITEKIERQDHNSSPEGETVRVSLGVSNGQAAYQQIGKIIAVGAVEDYDTEYSLIRIDGVPKNIPGQVLAPFSLKDFDGNQVSKEISLVGFHSDKIKLEGRPEVYAHAGCLPVGPGKVQVYNGKTERFWTSTEGIQTTCIGAPGVSGGALTATVNNKFEAVVGLAGGSARDGSFFRGKTTPSQLIMVPVFKIYNEVKKKIAEDLASSPCS